MQDKFLRKKLIGLSISESIDIEKVGFSEVHFQDSLVELARYLLACGANLAYGGDVKYEGTFNYAEILFDLIENFSQEFKDEDVRVINYICYPLYKRIPDEIKARYIKRVIFKNIDPSEIDISNDNWQVTIKGQSVKDLYTWAVSLNEMRIKMNNDLYARIVMGGKVTGFKGKYPGIVEEVMLSLKSNKPTYLIGAYGGAALSVISAIKGGNPEELQISFQEGNSIYRDLIPFYNGKHSSETINYPAVVNFFNTLGIEGLCKANGLNEDENTILFTSRNIIEIIMYILKGMKLKIH